MRDQERTGNRDWRHMLNVLWVTHNVSPWPWLLGYLIIVLTLMVSTLKMRELCQAALANLLYQRILCQVFSALIKTVIGLCTGLPRLWSRRPADCFVRQMWFPYWLMLDYCYRPFRLTFCEFPVPSVSAVIQLILGYFGWHDLPSSCFRQQRQDWCPGLLQDHRL